MSVIARWEVEVCDECGRHVMDSDHATSSHQNTDRTRWVEVVPASQLRGAVDAGAALYTALRDGHSLGDEAVHEAMSRWEALNPHTTGGQ